MGAGDLNLEFPTGSYLKSAAFGATTTGSAANVYYSSSVDQFLHSTSSARYKIIDSDMSIDDANRVLRLTPKKFYSTSPSDDPNKVFYGLTAEDVAENYIEAVRFNKSNQPESYDIQMIVAGLIKHAQVQEERIETLEKRV